MYVGIQWSVCAEWWDLSAPVCCLVGEHHWPGLSPGWRLENSFLRKLLFQEERSTGTVSWDPTETPGPLPNMRPPAHTELPTAFYKVFHFNVWMNRHCFPRHWKKTLPWWQGQRKRKRNSGEIETLQKVKENIKRRYSDKGKCHMHEIRVGSYLRIAQVLSLAAHVLKLEWYGEKVNMALMQGSHKFMKRPIKKKIAQEEKWPPRTQATSEYGRNLI